MKKKQKNIIKKNQKTNNPSQKQINDLIQYYQTRRLIEAEKLANDIIEKFPKHPFSWKVLGVIFRETGRKSRAANVNQKVVELSPQDAEAHSNLGVTLQELGRLDEAEASYKHAIALKPNYAEAYNNMGITLQKLGRLDKAEASFTQSIALKSDYAEAYNNLGNTLQELGRLDEAEASYRRAIDLKPDFSEAFNNIGIIFHLLGRLYEAETNYKQAIALKSDYAEAYNNLGNTLQELGRLDEAEINYKQAIALKTDYAEAHLNLCELLLSMNRNDELSFYIRGEYREILQKKADTTYYQALLEFRKEDYKTASELLEKININELVGTRKISAIKLQADIYHHMKNYSAAFEAYKSKNNVIKNSFEYKRQNSEKYFMRQKKKVVQIEELNEQSVYKSKIKPNWFQPTFLIGFPRSGTTLLDTILRTHSNIDVFEELPMLSKMSSSLGDITNISTIEAMDNKGAEIASGFYFAELKKHTEIFKKQICVDKLPLNILQLPLINQVFPNSKYIIALRHPLDCILSCWMQSFKLNPPMANMIELERIVEFYDVAMSILKLSKDRYSLDTHEIRYEDLVIDFKDNVSNLLTFLDLKWEEGLTSYQKTALSRDRIRTPSSAQVIKPLYQSASYRWKHYEEHLVQYKIKLMPWIKEYGY